MENKTQLWNLHKQLKDEITLSDTRNNQIKVLLITASGAIFGLGLKQDYLERPLILLGVYLIVIPLNRILTGNRKDIWRISTYLRTFIEPKLDEVKWETRLYEQGNKAMPNERGIFLNEANSNEFDLVKNISLLTLGFIFINLLVLIGIYYNIDIFPDKELKDEKSILLNISISAIAFVIGTIIHLTRIRKMGKESKGLERLGTYEEYYLKSWEKIKEEEKKARSEQGI